MRQDHGSAMSSPSMVLELMLQIYTEEYINTPQESRHILPTNWTLLTAFLAPFVGVCRNI